MLFDREKVHSHAPLEFRGDRSPLLFGFLAASERFKRLVNNDGVAIGGIPLPPCGPLGRLRERKPTPRETGLAIVKLQLWQKDVPSQDSCLID